MPQHIYIDIYMRLCKALLDEDEEWDEAEAKEMVEGSWQEDSRGEGAMTRPMFTDGLFGA